MLCESGAVLQETLAQIDFSDIPHQLIGDRALVVPAPEVEAVREALHDRGIFPRIVGEVVDIEEEADAQDEIDDDVQDDEEDA